MELTHIASVSIQKMRRLNIAIEDEKVSSYIDEMAQACLDIFSYVKTHTDKEEQIKSFTTYYLPETLRLLKNYDEMSKRLTDSPGVAETLQEITETLEVILRAFKNLHNQLYTNQILKVSTDGKVLKDILMEHGLLDENENGKLRPQEVKK